MRALVMAALALFFAGTAWAERPRNPYVLAIDRAPYTLSLARADGAAAAAAGGSVPVARPVPASNAAERPRAEEAATLRLRQQEYERRISELSRERDAWKRHAEQLEARLLAGPAAAPLMLAPPR